MISVRRFTGCLFVSVLSIGAVCFGGETPPGRGTIIRQTAPPVQPRLVPDVQDLDTPPLNFEPPRKPSTRNPTDRREASNREPILESFKIATDGGLLLLPVQIQKKRYWFALDTGSRSTLYDVSLRSLLGKPVKSTRVRSSNQDITIPIFSSPMVKVGKLALPEGSEVVCMDLEKMRELSGQTIHGVLGMDFLAKYVFRIDFDSGELTFLNTVNRNAGERIPIVFRWDLPLVMVETRGFTGRGRFLVDTGCAGAVSGSIVTEAFDSLAKRGFLTILGRTHPAGLLGTSEVKVGCVHNLALGSFHHEKLVFAGSKRNILGLNYWSRYLVTFDFPNNAIYLRKGRRFDHLDIGGDISGLGICRRKGQTFVEYVAKDSPSAQAGIKPQDVLIKIDDTDISNLSLIGLQRLLREKGKKCRLLIQRDEKELEITIAL